MMVRCPECSTGFKLPDEQLSKEGVKLRCSKCEHVFRFREGDNGQTEIFYRESDRRRNEEGADAVANDDGEPRELERSGAPGLSSGSSGSSSASSDYNPFPHANVDLKPKKKSALGSSSGPKDEKDDASTQSSDDGASRTDPFDGAFDDGEASSEGAGTDPFDGAFDEEDDDEEVLEPQSAPRKGGRNGPPTGTRPPQAAQQPPTGAAAQPGPPAGRAQGESTANDGPSSTASGGQKTSNQHFGQQEGAYRPEEMVDPSFGEDGPAFDPNKGVVDQQPPAQSSGSSAHTGGPGGSRTAGSPGAAQSPRARRRQQAASQGPGASGSQQAAAAAAPTGRADSTPQSAGSWDVDDDLDDSIEPHTIGGSGLQKAANFVLITLLVGAGFLGVVAYLNDGVLDFERFDHMLQVAFEGEDFEPRAEWADQGPAVVPAPEDPVRFRGVFAAPVEVGDERVMLVRGKAKNAGDEDVESMTVRGLLRDADERVVTEKEAPLGGDLTPADLDEAGSPGEAESKVPDESASLGTGEYEPFSLIFDEVPDSILEDLDGSYKIEVADSEPSE